MARARFALAAAVLAAGALTGGLTSPPSRHLEHRQFESRAFESTNWAGYAVRSADPATPSSFTSVTGTWRQPAARCGGQDSDSAAAFWVGLGGYDQDSQALEQAGTEADCSPTGPTSYYAWYELVPAPPISFALRIRPGDLVTTTVGVSGTHVTIVVRNRTRGTVASERAVVPSPDLRSAEWIVEAPASCSGTSCDMVPLANFGAFGVSGIGTTAGNHAGSLGDGAWSTVPIALVPGSQQQFYSGPARGMVTYTSTAGACLAGSGPGAGGRSFTVAWAPSAGSSC